MIAASRAVRIGSKPALTPLTRDVADTKTNNQRIVLEDLDGIRETGKAKCVHEWSFAELQCMIRYKAARAGVEVVVVSPRYTSQTCSRWLHLGVRPSQSNFQCRDSERGVKLLGYAREAWAAIKYESGVQWIDELLAEKENSADDE